MLSHFFLLGSPYLDSFLHNVRRCFISSFFLVFVSCVCVYCLFCVCCQCLRALAIPFHFPFCVKLFPTILNALRINKNLHLFQFFLFVYFCLQLVFCHYFSFYLCNFFGSFLSVDLILSSATLYRGIDNKTS